METIVQKYGLTTFKQRVRRYSNFGLTLYVMIYMVLTLAGSYMRYPVASGEVTIGGGWAVRDKVLWQPRDTLLTYTSYNWLGLLYGPLILIDRCLWHKTHELFPWLKDNRKQS